MSKTLLKAVQWLHSRLLEMQDNAGKAVKGERDGLPEAINIYPYVVTFPKEGTGEIDPVGTNKGLHVITVEVHLNRANLVTAISSSLPFFEKVITAALTDPTWGGNINAVVGYQYTWGRLFWGDTTTPNIGWHFEITVKIQEAI